MNDLTVLIIEDDINTRSTLRMMLGEIGITQIFESKNGVDAMQYIDTAISTIDMIICDWNMPHKTGLDVLKEIRTIDRDIPFLMVTARADKDSVMDAREANVSGYIRKPFTMRELETKLKTILNNV